MPGGGGLGGLMRRLRGPEQAREQDRRLAAEAQEGAVAVARCGDRDVVALVGVLTEVTTIPQGQGVALQADFGDGTGHVRLVWMGRRSIRGIDVGRRLRVEGRLSHVDGRRTIYNPRYALLPPQA